MTSYRALSPSDWFEQILLVAKTPEGNRQAIILWSHTQLEELEKTHEVLGNFLGQGTDAPQEDHRQPLKLGGDYPVLFEHIQDFWISRTDLHEGWNIPRGIHICVAPTVPGETHGLVGRYWQDRWEMVFYPDKAKGRELLRRWNKEEAEFAPTLKYLRPFIIDEHLPYLDRALLPEQSDQPNISLGPRTAHWFVWWYFMYYEHTDQVR